MNDFNGDAKPDLVMATTVSGVGSVSILLGDGAGGVGSATHFAAGGAASAVAAGDFNQDGNLDLAAANGGPSVSILLGDGHGAFGPATPFVTHRSARSLAIADFNGDSKLDLAVADFQDNVVSILLGVGDGSFGAPTQIRTRIGPNLMAVVAGDFDGDGKSDLAVANHWIPVADSFDVQVLLGTGTGSFNPLPGDAPWVTAGKNPREMAVGDFNQDGKLDLVVGCVSEGVSVLLGTGGGNLVRAAIYPPTSGAWDVAVGDVDGDGHVDLAVSNINFRPSSFSVLLGSGSGSFATPASFAVGNRAVSIALSDLNADGRLDVAVANEDSNTVSVLLNTGPVPLPPVTLTVSRVGSGSGTVTSDPSGINCGTTCAASYAFGSQVTLAAAAPSGSFLAGWSGAGCTGVDPCRVTLDANATVTATFSVTAFTFTDETLSAQQTPVKAVHVTELRQAIDAMRANRGLAKFVYTDPVLTAGATQAKGVHIAELRMALDAVYVALGRQVPTYTDPTLTAGQTVIKRVHIMEIRLALRALE